MKKGKQMWNGRKRALKNLLFHKTNKEHLLKKKQNLKIIKLS